MTGSQMTVRFWRQRVWVYIQEPPHKRRLPRCWLPPAHLAATGETLVVVWSPAGAVSVVLLLEEAGLRVFFQLLHVLHQEVIKLPILLLLLPPGAELTRVWHVDLEEKEGFKEKPAVREGLDTADSTADLLIVT